MTSLCPASSAADQPPPSHQRQGSCSPRPLRPCLHPAPLCPWVARLRAIVVDASARRVSPLRLTLTFLPAQHLVRASSHSRGVLVDAASPKVTAHAAQRALSTRSGVRSPPLLPPNMFQCVLSTPLHPKCSSVFSAAGGLRGGEVSGARAVCGFISLGTSAL